MTHLKWKYVFFRVNTQNYAKKIQILCFFTASKNSTVKKSAVTYCFFFIFLFHICVRMSEKKITHFLELFHEKF